MYIYTVYIILVLCVCVSCLESEEVQSDVSQEPVASEVHRKTGSQVNQMTYKNA